MEVSTWQELRQAIEVINSNGAGNITLGTDIIFNASADFGPLPTIIVSATVQGNGFQVDAAALSGDERPVFQVRGSDVEVTFKNIKITGGYAFFGGGGVLVEESGVRFVQCQILGNASEMGGGGVHIRNGRYAEFEDCDIADNRVLFQSRGGGVCFDGGLETRRVVFKNCKVTNNRSQGEGRGGGGIYLWRAEASFETCELSGNETKGLGGGLYLHEGSTLIKNSRLFDNRAKEGGGIYALGSRVRLDRCQLGENRTEPGGRGGGLLFSALPSVDSEDRLLSLTNTQVLKNVCGYAGGGVCIEMGRSFFSGVVVSGNSAEDADSIAGGMFAVAPAVFKDTLIQTNAARSGADLYLSSDFGGRFESLGNNDIGEIAGRFFPSGGANDRIKRD